MSSSQRGKSSRGRGGGRGSRSGRGRSKGGNSNSARSGKGNNEEGDTGMSDEDVLIAFTPFMRSEDAEALRIHDQFQSSDARSGHRAFIRAARDFLLRKESGKDTSPIEYPRRPDNNASGSSVEPAPAPPASPLTPGRSIGREEDLTSRFDSLVMKEDPIVPVSLTQTPPRDPIGLSLANATVPFAPVSPRIRLPVFPAPAQDPPPQPDRFVPTPPSRKTPTLQSMDQVERAPQTPAPETPSVPPELTPTTKPKYMQKRLWTRVDQQPGKILVNNMSHGHTLDVRPRQELTARWMLPLAYLRERISNPKTSIADALANLSVGLHRRGGTENGESHSIISKMARRFQVDGQKDIVWGTVPFYAPRTPGNVVFRLYWSNKPLHTLATGPTLNVRVTEAELEPTLRFILSNFKAKKGSGLSSLHSLVLVLEHFRPAAGRNYDGAGRAAWGCICESRKVLEGCGAEFSKTSDKMSRLESEIEDMKALQAEEAEGNTDSADEADDDEKDALESRIREKTRIFMGGVAANKRKWRDAQVAFAAVLRVTATSRAISLLLKRDHIVMLRLELELWCPLCETFASSPFHDDDSSFFRAARVPLPLVADHFEQCANNRKQMQIESLGFVPNRQALDQILMPGPADGDRQMSPSAVETFNSLSASMGQLYQEQYFVSDIVHRQREIVRSHVESVVDACDAFPSGTKVIVFGSSANGFGSPSSDIDMCLQLPPNSSLADENDPTGAIAMAKLANLFEARGMKDVNTDRLTARIPILMFACPRPMASNDEDQFVECDLSMQNPLACLNTSLLLTYSQIHVLTRVLAAMIKRWAKSRDMNSPHKHTLSTYGYLITLLHFLTYHRRTGNGLITSLQPHRSDSTGKKEATSPPLLPNLQWMDPRWPNSPPNTPYQELTERPRQVVPHPLEGRSNLVNTYFYRLQDTNTLTRIQQLFPGNDLSLSILLASFFRYYAYEFDYKKHVVSLQSTMSRGLVEREHKAEQDGWKVFGVGLAIEDPFETSYDVAHVLKGTNFHRLQNEFALAYTKIADSAMNFTRENGWSDVDKHHLRGMDLLDWICEPVGTNEEGDEETT